MLIFLPIILFCNSSKFYRLFPLIPPIIPILFLYISLCLDLGGAMSPLIRDFGRLRMDSAEVSSSELVSLALVYDVEADTEVLVLASDSTIAQYPAFDTKTRYYN